MEVDSCKKLIYVFHKIEIDSTKLLFNFLENLIDYKVLTNDLCNQTRRSKNFRRARKKGASK